MYAHINEIHMINSTGKKERVETVCAVAVPWLWMTVAFSPLSLCLSRYLSQSLSLAITRSPSFSLSLFHTHEHTSACSFILESQQNKTRGTFLTKSLKPPLYIWRYYIRSNYSIIKEL